MRRGYTLRFLFLTSFCAVLIVGLHFYMYIYKKSSNRIPEREGVFISQTSREPLKDRVMAQSSYEKDLQTSSRLRIDPQHDPRKNLEHKIIHLDLKGAPLKIEAYETLFPFFAQLGVTGILMEYEDMFPYKNKLSSLSNRQAYSEEGIRKILRLAESSHLQVIPLIQTFGHLEFVLKLEEFAPLREVPRYMQVLCPTNNESQVVIHEMIDQVMSLHPNIKNFHIGSDEVYHIGMCHLCQDRMAKFNIQESHLFLQHVRTVAEHVKSTYNVQPLMWDDEFRKLDENVILQSGLGSLVEIVVWNYSLDVENAITPMMWEKYARIFKSVWIGSAFKGANKPNSIIVNETLYLNNHLSWLRVMTDYNDLITFKGIMLTGWQRYDHFSVLCELLPSAIPSLAACMKFMNSSYVPHVESILQNVSTSLNCGNYLNYCNFPGSTIHQEINQLEYYKTSFKRLKEQNVYLGWAQEINLRFEFSSPAHIEPIFQEVNTLKLELDRSRVPLEKAMQEMFPQWSVDEWMMTNFQRFYDKVKHLHTKLGTILDKQFFSRRPLNEQIVPNILK